MGYKLSTAGSFSSDDPTDADLRRAFASDGERGEFIILDGPDGSFIQASGQGDGPFSLEFKSVDGDLCAAGQEASKAQVEEAFQAFLRGDDQWRAKWTWKPVKKKAGCLAFSGLFLIGIAVVEIVL